MKSKLIFVLPFLIIFCLLFIGCNENKGKGLKHDLKNTDTFDGKSIVDMELDHFYFWAENPDSVKECLTRIGFNMVADSLSTIHEGQGNFSIHISSKMDE